MPDEIELNGKVYKRFGGEWHDANFIRVPQAIARELDVLALGSADIHITETVEKRSTSSGNGGGSAFSEEDVSPVIAQLIRERHAASGDYVKHRQLVDALLHHDEAREHIDDAVEQKGHSPKQWASWMVQSFSAAMTAERSPYQDDFERRRVDNQWAYRPMEE